MSETKTETMAAVRNNPSLSRFELETEAGIAVVFYRTAPGALIFYHTEVPAALRERGIASRLVHDALELARAEGLKVIPGCGFVMHYIDTHPQFQDLVR